MAARKQQVAIFGQKMDKGTAYIGGGILIAGILYLIFKPGNNDQKTLEEILKEIQGAGGTTVPGEGIDQVNLYDAAGGIADALGFNLSIWDPGYYAEDEHKAAQIILAVPNEYIPELEKIYAGRYKRNLRQDMQDLGFDGWSGVDYWDMVKHKFV